MRIISGTLKRRIITPPPSKETRPTLDRVRQRIFDLLASRLSFEHVSVLDLFAGTGALGFEAASRGAMQVTFVEHNLHALNNIKLNANQLRINHLCHFSNDNVWSYLSRNNDTFDLIFADPPYAFTEPTLLIKKIVKEKKLNKNGWFIFEHTSSISFFNTNGFTFAIKANKRISVSFFHSI